GSFRRIVRRAPPATGASRCRWGPAARSRPSPGSRRPTGIQEPPDPRRARRPAPGPHAGRGSPAAAPHSAGASDHTPPPAPAAPWPALPVRSIQLVRSSVARPGPGPGSPPGAYAPRSIQRQNLEFDELLDEPAHVPRADVAVDLELLTQRPDDGLDGPLTIAEFHHPLADLGALTGFVFEDVQEVRPARRHQPSRHPLHGDVRMKLRAGEQRVAHQAAGIPQSRYCCTADVTAAMQTGHARNAKGAPERDVPGPPAQVARARGAP